LRAIKQAREKPLDVQSLADIGVDGDQIAGAAGSRRRKLATPDRGEGAEILDGSMADVAARIAAIVKERIG
jgi:electron transfer flavoprotein beta subunit